MKFLKKFSIFIIIYLVFLISNVYAEELPEKFDLREHINIEIRNQKDTNTCWAFATTSLLSTHLAYIHDEIYTFSSRHLEYAMSEDAFTDSTNEYAYKTKVLDIGGNENVIKQYYAQGTGPIFEKHMQFQNNSFPIKKEELPLDLQFKQVTEASHILAMNKEWKNGQLIYYDYMNNVIDSQGVKEYQNSVKRAIKEYGGIDSVIAYDKKGFNSNGSFNTKELGKYWHSILLIGWDDTYSKDNFNFKPTTDGAYIALNSWGEGLGDNGYMYISYEDVSIDSSAKTYLKKVEDVDYDNVYYQDLTKAKQNGETLTEFTVVVNSQIAGYTYAHLKVNDEYVFINGYVDDCIENFVLEEPIQLSPEMNIEIEINIPNEYKKYIYPYFYTVTNTSQFESGKLNSNILDGVDGKLNLYTKHNAIDNGKEVEVKIFKGENDCTSNFNILGNKIKSNQTDIEISSKNAYNGEYVVKLVYNEKEIQHEFTLTNGLEEEITNIPNDEINSENKEETEDEIIDDNNKEEIKEESKGEEDLIEKEDKEEIDKENNNLSNNLSPDKEITSEPNDEKVEVTFLKGDVSLDGKITVLDLSKLKGYIVHTVTLDKNAQENADINSDGKITALDISLIKEVLVGII